MDISRIEKDLAALEHMRRARMNFEARICEASATRSTRVVEDVFQECIREMRIAIARL